MFKPLIRSIQRDLKRFGDVYTIQSDRRLFEFLFDFLRLCCVPLDSLPALLNKNEIFDAVCSNPTYLRGQNVPVDESTLQEREAKRRQATQLQQALLQQVPILFHIVESLLEILEDSWMMKDLKKRFSIYGIQ